MPDKLKARFSHAADFDYICLRLALEGAAVHATPYDEECQGLRFTKVRKLSVYMSSVWCPFRNYIRFLEAIAIQVQECSFSWDAEGPDGGMKWERRGFDDTGILTISWVDRHRTFKYRMVLETRQALRMLYTAFRRFVESPEYDPLRYEELDEKEAIALVIDSNDFDALVEIIINIDADRAERFIHGITSTISGRSVEGPNQQYSLKYFLALAESIEIPYIDEDRWIDPGNWSIWSQEQRKSEVHDMFERGPCGWFGDNLRELRSPLIEEWLSKN